MKVRKATMADKVDRLCLEVERLRSAVEAASLRAPLPHELREAIARAIELEVRGLKIWSRVMWAEVKGRDL